MKSVEEKERDEAHLHVLQNNSEIKVPDQGMAPTKRSKNVKESCEPEREVDVQKSEHESEGSAQPIEPQGAQPSEEIVTAGCDIGEISEDAPDDLEGLDATAAHVANLLATEPADIKLGVGGFSIGAATALYSSMCHVLGQYGNGNPYTLNLSVIVGLSGWLPCSRALKNRLERSQVARRLAASLPILLCHGLARTMFNYGRDLFSMARIPILLITSDEVVALEAAVQIILRNRALPTSIGLLTRASRRMIVSLLGMRNGPKSLARIFGNRDPIDIKKQEDLVVYQAKK
ncbi:hypothetical protein POM88_001315 [Heracleum sosnowskyi]|uniref:Phospholipase/carboxylesterase/thioesterase domain-containing protein n=1 Tax=Heracleum sosnowskyi TaxID=360622 RepID=A0AAD8JFV9_9APIA|nr:hypothetical protein POM88_001315 [Heracleum sosnowskyi]